MSNADPQKGSGLFGNFFDLNNDGRTDAGEAALMFMMFDEIQQEEERKRQAQVSRTYDIDDIDLDDSTIDLDDMDIEGI